MNKLGIGRVEQLFPTGERARRILALAGVVGALGVAYGAKLLIHNRSARPPEDPEARLAELHEQAAEPQYPNAEASGVRNDGITTGSFEEDHMTTGATDDSASGVSEVQQLPQPGEAE
ncbi:MAG TPA: hypothetical protein VIM53_01655 [Candidatus Saccharimonadales bacterium]